MKPTTTLACMIWLVVVGGNVLKILAMPPQLFADAPQVPWPVVLLPAVVVVGAYRMRGVPGEHTLGAWVDRRSGDGVYRRFMRTLKPELMFAVMCASIVLCGLARQWTGTRVLPPPAVGFFASGSVAFMVAHFIRQRRHSVD